jgi:hypothetical protein
MEFPINILLSHKRIAKIEGIHPFNFNMVDLSTSIFIIVDIYFVIKIFRPKCMIFFDRMEGSVNWSRIIDIAEQVIETEGKSKADLSRILGVRSQYLSDLRSGKSKNPGSDFALSLINKLNLNPQWMQTGEGSALLPRQKAQTEIHNSDKAKGNTHEIWNVENVGNNNVTLISKHQSSSETEPEGNTDMFYFYRIPLLTKEQVSCFDPGKEIPVPTAYTGMYPYLTMIDVPERIRVFGTDLRAIVVFTNWMTPILNLGDIAIFEATGWGADGIYIYRMNDNLYISHIKFDGYKFLLMKEYRTEAIPWDEDSFTVIGRVRAVLKEIN